MTERKSRPILKLALSPESSASVARTPPPPRQRAAPSAREHVGLSPRDTAFAKSLLIHEDDHVLGFNKPAGLAVQGGAGVEMSLDHLLAAFAKSSGKKPRLVHRLDRETSGVLIVARTQPAAAALSQAFAGRAAQKTYLAIVCGGPPKPAAATIDIPLKKMARAGVDMVRAARPGDTGVLQARTRYRTLAASEKAALLELHPETGRLHQLRAHLSMIGHPIAGDGKYGGLFAIGDVAIPTMLLHASSLALSHPAGGTLRLNAPPPPAFLEAAEALGLAAPLAQADQAP
jgi:tRNA pseudouridine32 synthase/23S rRNA pseudouridine746 synthase